jgi:hypothetical protein
VNCVEVVARQRASLPCEVEQLASDHSSGACGLHQYLNYRTAGTPGQPKRDRRLVRGSRRQWNHDCTCSSSSRNGECAMRGKPAAAHVVVIHAWQVIVNEGVRVNDLD